MNKEIPNYWKTAIKMGHITEKEYWEKVEPCHILIMRAKERQKKRLISKFLKSWNYMMERIEFHTENPDSELMDEVSEEYKKWEKRQKK